MNLSIFYVKIIQNIFKHTAKDYHNQSVNPPVVRASTIIFKTLQDIRKCKIRLKIQLEDILIMEDKAHRPLTFYQNIK